MYYGQVVNKGFSIQPNGETIPHLILRMASNFPLFCWLTGRPGLKLNKPRVCVVGEDGMIKMEQRALMEIGDDCLIYHPSEMVKPKDEWTAFMQGMGMHAAHDATMYTDPPRVESPGDALPTSEVLAGEHEMPCVQPAKAEVPPALRDLPHASAAGDVGARGNDVCQGFGA